MNTSEYQKASAAIRQQVAHIKAIAARHQVDVESRCAAVCPRLIRRVAAVIPGSSRPGRMAGKIWPRWKATIPAAFWEEMRSQNLVAG